MGGVMAKRFFYVSMAILALVISYHLGASRAQSRTGTNPAVGIAANGLNDFLAVTAVGDVYRSTNTGSTWAFQGNVFGATTPTGP
jgi:hypothetical protein